jgi:hypothetical protein
MVMAKLESEGELCAIWRRCSFYSLLFGHVMLAGVRWRLLCCLGRLGRLVLGTLFLIRWIGLIVTSVTVPVLVEMHVPLVDIFGRVFSLAERGLRRLAGLPELPAFKDAAELAVCVGRRRSRPAGLVVSLPHYASLRYRCHGDGLHDIALLLTRKSPHF